MSATQPLKDGDHASPEQTWQLGCFSEYGTLHSVMVGRLDDLAYPAWSPNIRYLTGEIKEVLSSATGPAVNIREQAPHLWEALYRDVEGVVETFQAHGVEVLRPRTYLPGELTYVDELQGGHSLLYPADPTYVLGKHVIETCIRRPFRRKETWATRDVLMPYIERDPEVRHVAIPRAQPFPAGAEGPGPFLEGGDIIMVGNDVLCGATDLTSNQAGRSWLRRYLEPFGYTVHDVNVEGTWLHLLGVMCVVRDGLAIAHMPALGGKLPDRIADWDVIETTEEEALMLASVGMNIDKNRHMIDRRFERLMGELDRRGVEPIPVSVDHLSAWGGAVRCVALPLSRDAD